MIPSAIVSPKDPKSVMLVRISAANELNIIE